MNLREKLFVEGRTGTKVTLSESDLNKMDRMYERCLLYTSPSPRD